MTWIDSEHDVVIQALSGDVRLLTHQHASRLLGLDATEAELVLSDLVSEGLAVVESHLVSVPDEESPSLCWSPGDNTPDFGALAYHFRNRVGESLETELILPSANLCKRFGGTRVRPRASEWSHDILVSNAYVYYCEQLRDQEGLSWVSGDTLRSDGEAHHFPGRVPDAILRHSDGNPVKVIEGAGSGYSRSKLSKLHASYCSLPYELW